MLLIMFANRLKVAYPILLVLGGLAISFIPNVPTITLNPDLVLIIFLPPLLYADVFSLSLKEMWKWRRIISSLAFIVVFITAAAVAWVANMVFPGFSLALGAGFFIFCGLAFLCISSCFGCFSCLPCAEATGANTKPAAATIKSDGQILMALTVSCCQHSAKSVQNSAIEVWQHDDVAWF